MQHQQLSINICCPRWNSAANGLHAAAAVDLQGTDRRTDIRPLHRPCTAYYGGSVNKQQIKMKQNERSKQNEDKPHQAEILQSTAASGHNCWSQCDHQPGRSDSGDADCAGEMPSDLHVQILELSSHRMKTLRSTCLQYKRPFNSLFSRTKWIVRYEKSQTILDFHKAT